MVFQKLHPEFSKYHNCFCTLMLVHLGDILVAEKVFKSGFNGIVYSGTDSSTMKFNELNSFKGPLVI